VCHQEGSGKSGINEIHQLLVIADYVNIWEENANDAKKNNEAVLETCRHVDLEAEAEKYGYKFLSPHKTAGQNRS
jgi:hypothetical protein